jgi:hypothetical protein
VTKIKLFGRFLVCEPTAKSEQSFFSQRNSKEFESSKGSISFFLLSILLCGFVSLAFNH